MRLVWLFVTLVTMTSGQFAHAAELLSIRAGDEAKVSRLVLTTDREVSWTVKLNQNQLLLEAKGITSKLSTTHHLPMSAVLDQIELKNQAKNLRLSSQVTRPMTLVRSYQLPAKEGVKARFVVELVHKIEPTPVRTAQKVERTIKAEIQAQKLKTVTQHSAANPKNKPQEQINLVAAPLLTVKPFQGTKNLVVAIDAGHGGKDAGAISASGLLEKDLTLSVAQELKRQIDAQPGMKAVLTRDGDYFVSLSKRPQIARELNADVFISLHADSYKYSQIKGASFYVTSNKGASSQLAKFVAAHSNGADQIKVDGVEWWSRQQASTIGQVAMQSSLEDSQKLGGFLKQGFKKAGIQLQHSKVHTANFQVLNNIDMPSVLVEMGFISNPEQDQLLQQVSYQSKVAASLVQGLVSFVEVQPEPGVVYANVKVIKGDTLALIAQRHSTSVDYLRQANGIGVKSSLKPGQVLKVPVNMTHRFAMIRDLKG